jgi:nickel-dependent lactate racemase
VELPDTGVTVIEPVFRPAAADVHGALLHALRHPIDSPPLRAVVKSGQRVVISVCDITRAQPRRETLRAIFENCRSCDAPT